MNRVELQSLALIRVKESKILLDAGCFDDAYYLSGYAVECAVKACIASQIPAQEFPDLPFAREVYMEPLYDQFRTGSAGPFQRNH